MINKVSRGAPSQGLTCQRVPGPITRATKARGASRKGQLARASIDARNRAADITASLQQDSPAGKPLPSFARPRAQGSIVLQRTTTARSGPWFITHLFLKIIGSVGCTSLGAAPWQRVTVLQHIVRHLHIFAPCFGGALCRNLLQGQSACPYVYTCGSANTAADTTRTRLSKLHALMVH